MPILSKMKLSLSILSFLFLTISGSCKVDSRRDGLKQNNVSYFVKVIGITDGDTFKGLTTDHWEITFRIYGIDAPEKKQAYSQKSKQHLSDLIFGKTVKLIIQKKRDGFGRPVVWVYAPDGKDISAEMLKAGMAWHFKKYDSSPEYANYEMNARTSQLGLWKDENPIPPWEWKKRK